MSFLEQIVRFAGLTLTLWAISPGIVIFFTRVVERRRFIRNKQWYGFWPGNFYLGVTIAAFASTYLTEGGVDNDSAIFTFAMVMFGASSFAWGIANRIGEMARPWPFQLSPAEAKMPSKVIFDFLVFPAMVFLLFWSAAMSLIFGGWDMTDILYRVIGVLGLLMWYHFVRRDEGRNMHPHQRNWKNDLSGKLRPPANPQPGKSGWLDD